MRVHNGAGDNAACCALCLFFAKIAPALALLGSWQKIAIMLDAGLQSVQIRSPDSSGTAHLGNHRKGGDCRIEVISEQSLGMQGHEEQGRPLLERALVIQEVALGPDHPDVQAIRDVLEGED